MAQERTNWPLIVGITAGVIGGVCAALYLYTTTDRDAPEQLRDATDIIAQCHEKIKEIRDSLDALKHPIPA